MTADHGPPTPAPPAPGAGEVTGEHDPPSLADLVAAAVTTVDGVSGMHAGMFGEVATYLPGRRVIGVQLREDVTNVHVTLRWGVALPSTVDAIRAALAPVVDTPVHVTVEDVDAEPVARG